MVSTPSIHHRLLVLLAVGAGIAALVGWRLTQDPRSREIRRIQQRVNNLAGALSFSEKNGLLNKVAYAERVSEYFSDPTVLRIALGRWAVNEPVPRSQVYETAAGLRGSAKGLDVQFLDIAVDLKDSGSNATAHLTSKIYFHGDSDYWVQEFKLSLTQSNRVWRLQEVQTLKTMEQ